MERPFATTVLVLVMASGIAPDRTKPRLRSHRSVVLIVGTKTLVMGCLMTIVLRTLTQSAENTG